MGKEPEHTMDDIEDGGTAHKVSIEEDFGMGESITGEPEEEIRESNGFIIGVEILHENNALSAYVMIGMDEAKQGFGGIVFNTIDENNTPEDRLGNFISGVLTVMGVDSSSKLGGCPCRVKHTSTRIYELGHFVRDNWMKLEDYYDKESA